MIHITLSVIHAIACGMWLGCMWVIGAPMGLIVTLAVLFCIQGWHITEGYDNGV